MNKFFERYPEVLAGVGIFLIGALVLALGQSFYASIFITGGLTLGIGIAIALAYLLTDKRTRA